MRLHTLLLACAAASLLSACGDDNANTYQGYAEGDYVRVAALEGGIVAAVPVQRGDEVADGALLFQLDRTTATADFNLASARLEQARAQFADVSKGLRPTELDTIKAARARAAATAIRTSADLARAKKLFTEGHISKSALDAATANNDAAGASLREIEAQLATGKLSARADQVAAAEAQVRAAEATLANAKWRLSEREGHAPNGGTVDDVYFRVGETAAPGQPVVSILPPENIKLRFFIAEADLSHVRVGQKVTLACDGCAENLTGTVRFISTQAEYTPPVIYSENAKSKLVYMAEATPDSAPEIFHPGQPVRVTLAEK